MADNTDFTPELTLTPDMGAAAAAEAVSFLDRVYRGSISAMMSAMTAREALSQAEIEELYAILRQAEGKEERP